ncbi:MAG: lipopolysaccharide heptosyltransferase II [Candidatus Eisenbacteria bacterium]|nr:lipopolysaccharide heptosyltransferase II [Candidatus Eisenbacteria bacterium]
MSDERVWIRLPNWLGDALLARPLLRGLSAAMPGAQLRVAGPGALIRLLESDATFEFVDPWPADRSGRGALLARIRDWKPTAAVVLPPSFSSAFFAFHTHAPVRVGFAAAGRSLLLTHPVKRPARGDLHLSREYAALGRLWGTPDLECGRLSVTRQADQDARALLVAHGIGDSRYAMLGPGALYGPAKRWDAARFAELARRLAARGLQVLVCGTGAESDVCSEVARGAGAGAVDLSARTPLETLAALCARAAVAVCNDSGLAHLAAACGAPTVVLFGSTSSAWSAPLGERVRVIQHAPVCSPCFQRRCRIGYACLRSIEVAEVDSACSEMAA